MRRLASVLGALASACSALGLGPSRECDACAEGAAECVSEGLRRCEEGPNGCLRWGAALECPGTRACQVDRCVATCNQCRRGAMRCDPGSPALQSCATGPNGCLAWSEPQACGNGQICLSDKCSACAENRQCAAAEVCASGACSAAADREYDFNIISAILPARADGSAPDAYVALAVDARLAGRTSVVNGFRPAWNESIVATVHASSQVSMALWDRQPGVDEPRYIDGVDFGDPVELVHRGTMSGTLYDGSPTTLIFDIVPR